MFYVIGHDSYLKLDFVYDDTDNTIQAVDSGYRNDGIYSIKNIIQNKNTSYHKYAVLGDFKKNENELYKDLFSFDVYEDDDRVTLKVVLVISKVHDMLPYGIKKAKRYLTKYNKFNYPSNWFACIRIVRPPLDTPYLVQLSNFLGKSLILLPPDMIDRILSYYYDKDFYGLSLSLGDIFNENIVKLSDGYYYNSDDFYFVFIEDSVEWL